MDRAKERARNDEPAVAPTHLSVLHIRTKISRNADGDTAGTQHFGG
jgi:hypothetical protein